MTDGSETLEAIRDAIVKATSPKRIILFGSHARGTPRQASDWDLLVIVDTDRPSWEVGIEARLAAMVVRAPMDLIVLTPREYDEEIGWSSGIVAHAVRTGKVIYEAEG